ncbi:PREDICTED: serine-rich adhesin for platelets-like [Priapulus caudatus]|uniref:Serine-rich adhesin for platelets-like n=1 Tax=Priapulus caudatus TaxID=37621 RepID=A0ABM1EUP4_PRICU|nr:PREDICTED: serine-rich adhesin for platelets-like [Priapulus caudatus]
MPASLQTFSEGLKAISNIRESEGLKAISNIRESEGLKAISKIRDSEGLKAVDCSRDSQPLQPHVVSARRRQSRSSVVVSYCDDGDDKDELGIKIEESNSDVCPPRKKRKISDRAKATAGGNNPDKEIAIDRALHNLLERDIIRERVDALAKRRCDPSSVATVEVVARKMLGASDDEGKDQKSSMLPPTVATLRAFKLLLLKRKKLVKSRDMLPGEQKPGAVNGCESQIVHIPGTEGTTGRQPYMLKFPKGTLIRDVLKTISHPSEAKSGTKATSGTAAVVPTSTQALQAGTAMALMGSSQPQLLSMPTKLPVLDPPGAVMVGISPTTAVSTTTSGVATTMSVVAMTTSAVATTMNAVASTASGAVTTMSGATTSSVATTTSSVATTTISSATTTNGVATTNTSDSQTSAAAHPPNLVVTSLAKQPSATTCYSPAVGQAAAVSVGKQSFVVHLAPGQSLNLKDIRKQALADATQKTAPAPPVGRRQSASVGEKQARSGRPAAAASETPAKSSGKNRGQTELLEVARRSAAYRLAKNRFVSLFYWPALMSTIEPPQSPDESVAVPEELLKEPGERYSTHSVTSLL